MTDIHVEPGDRVAFARQWLRSTFNFTGWRPFARGVVTGLDQSNTLATVRWDDRSRFAGEPNPEETRVNVANLVREDRIPFEE